MTLDINWVSGYRLGINAAALKVKEKFLELPANAEQATKDLLLDLYNEIVAQPTEGPE